MSSNEQDHLEIIMHFRTLRENEQEGNEQDNAKAFAEKFKSHPSVKVFSQAYQEDDYEEVRQFVVANSPNIILARFKADYNKSLNLEAIVIEKINYPEIYRKNYSSNAVPVRLIESTKGFEDPRSVALFPENFKSKSAPKRNEPVFYFLNKFTERFKKITLPFIRSGKVNLEAFDRLLWLEEKQLELLAALWVVLHEHFHGTGALPYLKYSSIKNSRSTAALEELRVDILAIIEAHDVLKTLDAELSEQLVQFILAERLLRYPIESEPNHDYDARSSILFCKLLVDQNAIEITDNKIFVRTSKIIPALRAIAAIIDELERSVASYDAKKQKQALESYVNKKTRNPKVLEFENLKIFAGAEGNA